METSASILKQSIARKKFIASMGLASGAALLGAPEDARATTGDMSLTANQTVAGMKMFANGALFKNPGKPWLDVRAFGAIGNGTSNPVGNAYSTQEEANAAFPNTAAAYGVNLTDQIDWAAIQEALLTVLNLSLPSLAPTVRLGSGTFLLNRPLAYIDSTPLNYPYASRYAAGLRLIGDGMFSTVLLSQLTAANTATLTLDGYNVASENFLVSSVLAGFSLVAATTPAGNTGLYLRAQYCSKLDQISVRGFSGNGIYVPGANGDSDNSSFVAFSQLHVTGNAGIGIQVGDTVAGDACAAGILLTNSNISGNTLGGVQLAGLSWEVEGCQISSNGGIGLAVYNNGAEEQDHAIRRCVFDGNMGSCSIYLQMGIRIEVSDIISIHRPGGATVAVLVGQNGNTENCESFLVKRLYCQNGGGTGITAVVVENNSYYTRIEDITVDSGYASYLDNGINTCIREKGCDILRADAEVVATVASSNFIYTPNLIPAGGNDSTPGGTIHRIVVLATGPLTIGNPVQGGGAGSGRRLTLQIVNQSGGSISTAFGSLFLHGGYTDPANGHAATGDFYFETSTGTWRLVGAWNAAVPDS
jgi:hypothetical protein